MTINIHTGQLDPQDEAMRNKLEVTTKRALVQKLEGDIADLKKKLQNLQARNAQLEAAHKEWSDKTDWVQASVQTSELGLHRADVLRLRIEKRDAALAETAATAAQEKLRADQMMQRLDMANRLGNEARAELARRTPM